LLRSRSEAAFLSEKRTKQEIVRRVKVLFAFAYPIESKVATAREKTEKLRQSFCKGFFKGTCKDRAEIARKEAKNYETSEVS